MVPCYIWVQPFSDASLSKLILPSCYVCLWVLWTGWDLCPLLLWITCCKIYPCIQLHQWVEIQMQVPQYYAMQGLCIIRVVFMLWLAPVLWKPFPRKACPIHSMFRKLARAIFSIIPIAVNVRRLVSLEPILVFICRENFKCIVVVSVTMFLLFHYYASCLGGWGQRVKRLSINLNKWKPLDV